MERIEEYQKDVYFYLYKLVWNVEYIKTDEYVRITDYKYSSEEQ